MTSFYVVMVTCADQAEATRIARRLLELRLVGCAQVTGPVRSTYWWQGRLEESEEWVCLLKAPARNYSRIEEQVKMMHSYKVPEVLALPVEAGSKDYLDWLDKEATAETT